MISEERASSQNELTLKKLIFASIGYIKFVISKWYIVLFICLVGGLLGYYLADAKKPIYRATTTFVLDRSDNAGLSQYMGVASMVGFDIGSSDVGLFNSKNIQEIYKSRAMLVKTLLTAINEGAEELLVERYIESQGLLGKWRADGREDLLALNFRHSFDSISPLKRRLADSLMTTFTHTIVNNMLKIGMADQKSTIIQVDVESSDETFSHSFNENLVAHVNLFYKQTKIGKSSQTLRLLEEKADSIRYVLTGAIYRSNNLLDATPNLNPIRQSQRTSPVQQAQVSAETNKTILSQLVQNIELTKLNLMQEEPLIQIVDRPVYPLSVTRYSSFKWGSIGVFVAFVLISFLLVLYRYLQNIIKD